MEILITETKFNSVISKYMSNLFDTFTVIHSNLHVKNTEYYINNNDEIMAEVFSSKLNGDIIIIDFSLWSSLSKLFGFETTTELKESLKPWAKTYFGFNEPLIDFHEFGETIDDL